MRNIFNQYNKMNSINTVILSKDSQKILKLKDLLSKYCTLNITNVCNNSASATEILNHSSPTLLFMDISYTGVLQDVKKPPFIVGLCDTIYTKKVKQFLKMGFFEVFYSPYEEEELNGIIGKVLNILYAYNGGGATDSFFREEGAQYTFGDEQGRTESLFIMGTRNEESSRIFFKDVMFLSKVGNYVCVNFTDKTKRYYRSNLKMFSKRFPPSKFVKINRSIVVNADKVMRIVKNRVFLEGDEDFEISRSFRKKFKESIIK